MKTLNKIGDVLLLSVITLGLIVEISQSSLSIKVDAAM